MEDTNKRNPQPSRFTRYIDFSQINISLNGHRYPAVSDDAYVLEDDDDEEEYG